MKRTVILLASAIAIQTANASAADLVVKVTSSEPASGQILLSVFDNSKSWMKHPTVDRTIIVGTDETISTRFVLQPGRYGVALIHDANSNGKMDTNVLGLPTEAFGFSNGAHARFGPPDFSKAAFDLPSKGTQITISLDRTKR